MGVWQSSHLGKGDLVWQVILVEREDRVRACVRVVRGRRRERGWRWGWVGKYLY